MAEKGSSPILIVILVVALALGGYFVYQNQSKTTPSPQLFDSAQGRPTTQPTPTNISVPSDSGETANWKTYTNVTKEFTFSYPSSWYPENHPDYLGGNNVDFFLVGTKADHGYGDHKGNEVFAFELSEGPTNLEDIKKNYYPTAANLTISGKPAIKTSFNLYIIEVSPTKKLNVVGGNQEAKKYINQILSTFKFTH